ncbi:unnamed protein product [Paramecium primaurelia]|uniref:Uncharacterized protein n=1 Tax=Paramecium primaurelia TaxID=5886 RepID=A0A8S1NJW3_PARPR|nr:unnamed protein product [Paramecium primaurelia]
MDNPDDQTFSIKNPNAQTRFVVLTSMHYTGAIYFLLFPNNNQFSYSEYNQSGWKIYKSSINWLFCCWNLRSIYQFRIKDSNWNVQQWTTYNITKQMVFNCYTGLQLSKYLKYESKSNIYKFTNNHFIYLRLLQILQKFEKGMKLTLQIAIQTIGMFQYKNKQKISLDLSILPTFYLELVQSNQIYTTNGNYDYSVDKSIIKPKMNIQIKCENGKKIKADFNKCNSCSIQKTYQFTYNCFNQMNYVGFYPVFQQELPLYNHLKINMQASSLEITNIVYDQMITEKTIVKILILNQ